MDKRDALQEEMSNDGNTEMDSIIHDITKIKNSKADDSLGCNLVDPWCDRGQGRWSGDKTRTTAASLRWETKDLTAQKRGIACCPPGGVT